MQLSAKLKPCSLQRDTLSGFSMLEVLVALVILAIGLLGIVALELNGYRKAQDALYRGSAILLAEDLANRMIMNYPDSNLGKNSTYNSTSAVGAPNNLNYCTAPGCTNKELAQSDLAQVYANAAALLPTGFLITVCLDSTIYGNSTQTLVCDQLLTQGFANIFSIQVQWTDRYGTIQAILRKVRT